MLEPGARLHDRYTVERLIGYGGMATVYLARDRVLGDRQVAVKELVFDIPDPDLREMALQQFRTEAQFLARLQHPRLVPVFDFFESDNHAYLVMAYISGETLRETLARSPGFLPVSTVLEWGEQICEVLEYLHGQSPPVLFRDLKPTNIMKDPVAGIRLIDFGIARTLDPTQSTCTFLRGSGTVGFAPVEQFGGKTDTRSDIYGLGATLYCLLTGTLPPASVDRVCGQEELVPIRQINPDVPPALDDLVLRMMELRKENRPASVTQVRRLLAACREKSSSRSPEASGPASSPARSAAVSTQPAAEADLALFELARLLQEVGAGKRSVEDLRTLLRQKGWTPDQIAEPWRTRVFRALRTPGSQVPALGGETSSAPRGQSRPSQSGSGPKATPPAVSRSSAPVMPPRSASPARPSPARPAAAPGAAVAAPGAKDGRVPVGGKSLLEAVEKAPPGATLHLAPGTYLLDRSLVVTRSLVLRGEDRDRCVVRLQGEGPVLRLEGEGPWLMAGICFERAPTAGQFGHAAEVLKGRAVFEECRFKGGLGSREGRPAAGLRLGGTSEARVVGCEATRCRIGIIVGDQAQVQVEESRCLDCEVAGIAFFGRAEGLARRNECARSRRYGILVAEEARPRLEGNRCQGNETAGIMYAGRGGGVATDNTATQNHLHGIFLNDQAAPTLESNRCEQNKWAGIAYAGLSQGLARSNWARENGKLGFMVCGQAGPTLEQNHCEGNGQDGLGWLEGATGVARQNNLVMNARHGIAVGDRAIPTLQANLCRDNGSCGVSYEATASGTCQENAVEENRATGILVGDAASPALIENRCLRNEKAGIGVMGRSQAEVRENECTSNTYGIYVDEEAAPLLQTNNCLQNRASGIGFFGRSRGSARGNLSRGNVHGIYVDDQAAPDLGDNRCVQNQDSGVAWTGKASGQASGNEASFNSVFGMFLGDQAAPVLLENRCFSNKRSGIHFEGSAQGQATLNHCFNNGEDGIEVGERGSPELMQNRCHNNPRHGISWQGRARGTARDNELTQNGQDGGSVQDEAAPELEGNRSSENQHCGLSWSGNAAGRATKNRCDSNHQHGIQVSGRAHPTLRLNRCEQNKESGMAWRDQAGGVATGNHASRNDLHGILISDDAWPDIQENECRHNQALDIMVPPSRHRGG